MSAIKKKIKRVMKEINGMINLKNLDYHVPRRILENAIIFSIGADQRTIEKYIGLMLRLGYLKRGINRYVFIVTQRRL